MELTASVETACVETSARLRFYLRAQAGDFTMVIAPRGFRNETVRCFVLPGVEPVDVTPEGGWCRDETLTPQQAQQIGCFEVALSTLLTPAGLFQADYDPPRPVLEHWFGASAVRAAAEAAISEFALRTQIWSSPEARQKRLTQLRAQWLG